jgi:hypothetical protein
VEFVTKGEVTIIRPVRDALNPFQQYAGALGGFRNKDEIAAWTSELRDDEND